MGAVLFFPKWGSGHFAPTFALAHALRERGHDVKYVGIADFRRGVVERGFEYHEVLRDLCPPGWFDAILLRVQRTRGLGMISMLKELKEVQRRVHEDLTPELVKIFETTRPDLAAIDVVLPEQALIANAHARTVLISTGMPFVHDPAVPPVSSALRPRDGKFSPASTKLAWMGVATSRAVMGLLGLRDERALRETAERFEFPVEDIDFRATATPHPQLPELVLCPVELDYPGRSLPPTIRYVEPCIDRKRAPIEFPWARLDEKKPLVLCVLGSQAHLHKRRDVFFTEVGKAAKRRDDLQFVLAVGPDLPPSALGDLAADTIVAHRVPQLELLERASLMITHGGLGSIKECLYDGVPMVLFPLHFDQPGNAARVAHHGAGLVGEYRRAARDGGVDHVASLVDEAMATPALREGAARMREIFRRREREAPGVAMLESMLSEGPRPGAPSLSAR